ncbi:MULTISPECIES: hypothetical protein [Sinorhizobium]|uniref:hypothetical protein n=1 Tax=Sinorhizobium medicae TaxID=110321 RepID=UPI002AF6AD0E|nr:hypothetical protein [Sinorhizobium medicae]WQO85260.1 hypothetical protein U8C37_16900 [Sinorhizobium medicae]WQP08265.1 hypothetical protein U8C39_22030 [Sinorhizobium meliloti]WQP21680.1 hypothetical protein U8C33_22155 [Sinorhizobium meliloti]WQP35096.1 hypothetical protein U8C45_21985 [Sinorhizobium meliloti]
MPVVGKSGTIKKPVVIFDEGAPNPYANFITEVADEGDVVRVGFAALSQDGDGQIKAMIVVRLHLKKDIAWEMCRELRKIEEARASRRKK